MFICECVSYTAWKVEERYGARKMPYWGGIGNANQWANNADAWGIPKGKVPKIGSVGMHGRGPYGHVVWVEAVAGSRIYVSQYNQANAATNFKAGEYSEMWVDAAVYDWFIYFGEW